MLWMTLIGIGMPLGAFITQYFVMPKVDSSRPHMTKSWLMEGYERDHSLYPRRLSTYECGSEPVGEAYDSIPFPVLLVCNYFLGVRCCFHVHGPWRPASMDATESSTADPIGLVGTEMIVLIVFFATMTLGVWHVFRKRGRIYI